MIVAKPTYTMPPAPERIVEREFVSEEAELRWLCVITCRDRGRSEVVIPRLHLSHLNRAAEGGIGRGSR